MAKQITKISFTDGGNKGVSIGYKNFGKDGLKDVTTKECKGLPAKEFQDAMAAFKWHMLFLCEFYRETDYNNFPTTDVAAFRVCGVTKTGSDEKEGIMITGYKTLSNGKGFSFNTPNTKLSEEGYPFMNELNIAWEELVSEVEAYMAGKYAVVQLELHGEAAPEPSESN